MGVEQLRKAVRTAQRVGVAQLHRRAQIAALRRLLQQLRLVGAEDELLRRVEQHRSGRVRAQLPHGRAPVRAHAVPCLGAQQDAAVLGARKLHRLDRKQRRGLVGRERQPPDQQRQHRKTRCGSAAQSSPAAHGF